MNASQKRAIDNHRRRLAERGMSRYEVRGLAQDKELVRKLAKRLVENSADTERLRHELARQLAQETPPRFLTGRDIWEAFRRSPLVGADLNLDREVVTPRDVDL
jgi:hypothetical protein